MKLLHNILLMLALLPVQLTTAQQLAYRHFSTNEGLPHPQIYMTKTGPDGSLWIATDNGLSRFDGNRFHNYYPKHATGTNYVLDMDSLPGGELLLNVYKGGACILRNDSIIRLTVNDSALLKKNFFSTTQLYTVNYDPFNRCIWAIDNGRRLFRMVLKNQRLTVDMPDTAKRVYYSIHVSKENKAVYFATGEGLFTYSAAKRVEPLPNLQVKAPVHRIFEKNSREFILGMEDGILTANLFTGQQVLSRCNTVKLKYDNFLYDARRGYFWIPGQDNGIFIFREPGLQKPFLHVLKGTMSNYLYADNENVWCSTYGGGLYQFRQTYIVNYSREEGLDDNYITHISFFPQQEPYISCLRSYYRFNTENRQFAKLLSVPLNPYNKTFASADGQVCFINSKSILDKNGKKVVAAPALVYAMLPLNRDTMVITGYSDMWYYNGGLKPLGIIPQSPRGNAFTIIRHGNMLLFPSSTGLHVFNNGNWRTYNDRNGLGDGFLHAALPYNDTIFCGTRTGLYAIDRYWRVLPLWKNILGDEDIDHLCADKNGGIWIGTQKGLYLQTGGKLYHFDIYDGFVGSEVTSLAAKDNELYVGTTQGLSIADLDLLYRDIGSPVQQRAPETGSVLVNGREVPVTPGMVLKLKPNENNLDISLRLVQFNPQPLTVLEYSLDDGMNWTQVTGRSISLKSLSYGSYTLKVRTRHRNESVNYYMQPFRFRIMQPWYQNILVIFGVSLALSALGIWLYSRSTRNRRKRAQQQLALKKQMLDLEQKAMAALLNPHFVFNAINSINYYINNREEEKYTRLLTDLSRLIRLNLNNTYRDSVTLESELEIVRLYVEFEKHRFIRHPLQFDVINDSRIAPKDIKIPSMIIQPFVENSIWHGLLPKNGGRVWLHIKDAADDYLLVEIHDEGDGIVSPKEQNPDKGVRGIQLIQERISAYNQLNKRPIRLYIPSAENNEGFFVRLSFPVELAS